MAFPGFTQRQKAINFIQAAVNHSQHPVSVTVTGSPLDHSQVQVSHPLLT